jgi:YidC/Oxa1 family membrane protein insertase
MAKLAPKIELIKAKYKGRNDQPTMQKQQQEIMELQQKEGYSPLSGCLPLLIQLPLIMLLYTVINNPLSYIAKPTEEFADKDMDTIILEVYKEITVDEEIDKLEKLQKGSEIKIINEINKYIADDETYKDTESLNTREKRIAKIESFGLDVDTIPNFDFFGVNLAETPSLKNFSILCLIPVLAAAAQWVSMWLTRKFNGNNMMQAQQDAQAQASMKMMDIMFPGMTLFMAFSFSGMLGLYWTFQALLGLLQSFILAKAMPLPKYTEEEIKSFHKAQKAAEKAQREIAKTQPKYRSLHYIDDEDYDVLPDAPVSKETKSSKIDGDIPEIKD